MTEDDSEKKGSEGDGSEGEKKREHRIRGFARRIFREDSEVEEGSRSSNRELLGAILETGDKAKSEIVRMIGREVRSYLEALDLHNDIHHLLTNYSLEVKASIHLKPLADAMEDRRSKTAETETSKSTKPKESED